MSTTEHEYLHVKPAEIKLHPDNPRHEVVVDDDMVASVKSLGVLEPLIVAPPHTAMAEKAMGNAKWLLIAGHRRLAAAKKAKLKALPVVVRTDLASRGEQIEAMAIENLHRTDLTPIEEGEVYQLLLDVDGLTPAKVAQRIHQPAARVRDRLKLVKLPKGVQAHVGGQISLTEATDAAAFASDPETMARLEEAAGTNNFAVELAQAQARRKAAQDFKATVKQIRDAGLTVLEQEPEYPSRVGNLSGMPYDYRLVYGKAPEKWAAEKKVHADCPGRAVFIDEDRQLVDFACTQPESHRARHDVQDIELPETPEAKAARDQALAERQEAERARAELQTTLDAAADVRREHIGQILHHPTGDEALAKRLLARWLLADANEFGAIRVGKFDPAWQVTAKLLRIAPDVDADKRADLVARNLDKLTLPALAIIAALAYWMFDGDDYLQRGQSIAPGEWEAEWVRILTDDLAYTWSDFEKDHFGLTPDGHIPGVGGGDER